MNIFLPITVFIVILSVVLCIAVNSVYIDRVKDSSTRLVSGFALLSSTDPEYFFSGAKQFCEEFEYKDKLEVQVIDFSGKTIISTSGFEITDEKKPDYESALASGNGTGTYMGKSAAGEKILASTYLLEDNGSGSNGAIRYIVSLTPCYRRIYTVCTMIIVVFAVMIIFTGLSGLYFIKSIAQPIREVTAVARKIASGDFKENIKTDRDDEIGELCDSVNYMASELKNAENLKNDFISSVSHELRTPLTAIKGWGETAKMSVGTDEELVNRGLDVILSESDRLSSLVEELLDFSRMQNGRLSLNSRYFFISPVLSEAAAMYVELAKKQNIEVIFTPPVDDSSVYGDPDRLKQVFINIIDNAVKYTVDKGQVLIEQREEEGCVRISVKDTGIGIPEQDIDRVKEKFYKANKTVRGSGIGLSVSDEIVKQHNGLLFIESTEGIGTTVTVVLPVSNEPESESAPKNEQNTGEVLLSDIKEAAENEAKEDENAKEQQ